MEGIQGWVREQSEHLGKGYAWNLICKYVWHFSSKAVAYRFGENPAVPRIAALEVCFGYLWLIRGAQVSWPLFTMWVTRVGSWDLQLRPAALCGQCFSTTWCYWCMCSVVFGFKLLVLLGFNCALQDSCMLLSFCDHEKNAVCFGIKHQSILFQTHVSAQPVLSDVFLLDLCVG